jgi:hypothetical protein
MSDKDKPIHPGERIINQSDTDKAITEFLEEIKIAKQN